jgi:N-acetylneuraminic acid mutarotase
MILAPLVTAIVLALSGWLTGAPLPEPRSEVAGARLGNAVVVIGGFVADGHSSVRVDSYHPGTDRWSRLPDLPLAVNHAMAATVAGRLYVVGGYADGKPQRGVFVLRDGRWRALPKLPQARAAAGAAALGGKLYIVGGVGPSGLASDAFVYDPGSRRWSSFAGPTPREHLGVAALGGRIYVAGGRTAGFDTNLTLLEAYRPAEHRWRRLAPLPVARGGTGLAASDGRLVSVGGEAPGGTIASVYAYRPATNRWKRLPDLPTPRHGLAVVGFGKRVHVIGGGPEPGLSVSAANEWLGL